MGIEIKSKRPAAHMVRISPAMAEEWLKATPENQRPLNEKFVTKLARAMLEGRWIDCAGPPIIFDRLGNLVDGQHRLHAVVRARKAVTSFVNVGVPSQAIHVIDKDNMKRTVGQSLKMIGEMHYNVLAGALKWLWVFERGDMSKANSVAPDTQEIVALLAEHPDIRASVLVGRKSKQVFPSTLAAFTHYVFQRIDADDAAQFFELLTSGAGLSKHDCTAGIWAFRERLLTVRTKRGLYMTGSEKIALCFKAWNAYRQNRIVRTLKMMPSEACPEPI
jgi:hypothetical protein